ncbi:MAG: type II toxin-antitoxin system RelE/ParE family toxin [Bacteroidota bacterium]
MVRYQIGFSQDAANDILYAVNWYNDQQNNLGKKYFNTVKASYKILAKNPYAFAIKYDDIGCIPVNRFPFLIHYKIYPEIKKVIIFAVFHSSLDPDNCQLRPSE